MEIARQPEIKQRCRGRGWVLKPPGSLPLRVGEGKRDDDAPATFAAALAEQGSAERMLPLADLLVRVLGQA